MQYRAVLDRRLPTAVYDSGATSGWPRGQRRRLLLLVTLAFAGTATAILLIGRAAHYAELLRRLRGAAPG